MVILIARWISDLEFEVGGSARSGPCHRVLDKYCFWLRLMYQTAFSLQTVTRWPSLEHLRFESSKTKTIPARTEKSLELLIQCQEIYDEDLKVPYLKKR